MDMRLGALRQRSMKNRWKSPLGILTACLPFASYDT